ncbi:hypothetical protein U1Q18_030212 [Sarracenia purpurea var. burkii]
MAESFSNFTDFLNGPVIVETFVDVLLCAVPIWLAVMIGLVIGWSWRPRWTGLVYLGLRSKLRFAWTLPPGFGARRLWLAFTALSVGRTLWFRFRGKAKDSPVAAAVSGPKALAPPGPPSPGVSVDGSGGDTEPSSGTSRIEDVVTENDLEHLLHLLESKDGVKGWQNMMEKSASNLTYQAWRREPETGPVVYGSRTVFEDASPELVRDFFWDDEFRPKWDPMLAYFKILEECPHTGTMIVHWIKKFPFFCSDREYIIGRRIWENRKTFYCVTKGVPYPALQRRDKPRRVDVYFSSWVIKPVPSCRRDGQSSACEVTLMHYEDMGIPKDVANLGVRHGMWGTVKKMHSGFRSYQEARKSAEAPISRSALMARITTKISLEENNIDPSELASSSEEEEEEEEEEKEEMGEATGVQRSGDHGGIDWKWAAIGGAIALACGLGTGVIRKGLFLGSGQRVVRR